MSEKMSDRETAVFGKRMEHQLTSWRWDFVRKGLSVSRWMCLMCLRFSFFVLLLKTRRTSKNPNSNKTTSLAYHDLLQSQFECENVWWSVASSVSIAYLKSKLFAQNVHNNNVVIIIIIFIIIIVLVIIIIIIIMSPQLN